MNTRLYASIAVAIVGLSSVAVSHRAEACGVNLVKTANGQWKIASPPAMSASASRMMFMAAASPERTRTIPNPLQFLEPVAGLYEFTMTSASLGEVDHGYSVWHADGSEIMNSGRPAGDTNFCLGTWAQTGPRSYTLNHFTLSWFQTVSDLPEPGTPPDLPGPYVHNVFAGPGNIREDITLSRDGKSYTGTFVLTQYDTSGHVVPGFPITGIVTGNRLTIDSPVSY